MPSIWRCPNCNRPYNREFGRCVTCKTTAPVSALDERPRIDDLDPLLEALKRNHPEREQS